MSGTQCECRQPGDSASASVQSLFGDPAFPVPASLAAIPTNCQEALAAAAEDNTLRDCENQLTNHRDTSQQGSFLSNWWSQVLRSSAANLVKTASTAHPPGLSERLQRRQKGASAPTRQPLFDLKVINLQLVQLVERTDSNCLELPRYTGKAQKKEVWHHCDVRAERLAQYGRQNRRHCRPVAVNSGDGSGGLIWT